MGQDREQIGHGRSAGDGEVQCMSCPLISPDHLLCKQVCGSCFTFHHICKTNKINASRLSKYEKG